MWRGICAVVAMGLSVSMGGSAGALTITLNTGGTSALDTFSGNWGEPTLESLYPTDLPDAGTSTSIDGGTSAETVHGLSEADFDFSFDHTRAAIPDDRAESNVRIYFSPDQDIDYVASGSYAAVDPDGSWVQLAVSLTDLSDLDDLNDDITLFISYQESSSTPDQSFTLGLGEGDTGNMNTGSLSGTLLKDHDYVFSYIAFIHADDPDTASVATATGSVSLTLVPEPSPSLLSMIGLITLMGLRVRRRS